MSSDARININGGGMMFIVVSSFLNNLIDISLFVLVVGVIVMANYYLSFIAIKTLKNDRHKTDEQKQEIEAMLFQHSDIFYAFAKLVGYAALMITCVYIDGLIGEAVPVINSFKTIVFVSEISYMEKVLNKGFNVDINFISKIISYLPKINSREKIRSPKHRKFQK